MSQVMTVREYKGWKVQEVKKVIQKMLIDRVKLYTMLYSLVLNYVHTFGQLSFA